MLGVLILLLGAISVFAQHASIKTATGYLHVYNGTPHSFTFEISGKTVEAKQAAGNPAFSIDGNLVQVLLIPRTNFDPDRKVKDDVILQAHQTWEMDYLKKEIFQSDLKVESESTVLGSEKALFWSFVRTKYTVEFDRDAFFTMRLGDGIVGLSTPVKLGEDISAGRERLSKILKTIKISEKPFDIQKLSDNIRKGLPIS
ncbi:MAG: hypothetical protein ABL984_13040 [Pyrinomonadaceae bacterium]